MKETQQLLDITNCVLNQTKNGSNSMTSMSAKSIKKELMAIEIEDKFVACFIADLC